MTKNQENKQPIEKEPQVTQLLECLNTDVKTTMINIFKNMQLVDNCIRELEYFINKKQVEPLELKSIIIKIKN